MSDLNIGKTKQQNNKKHKNKTTNQQNKTHPLNDYVHKSEYIFVGIFLNKHIPPT